MIFLSAIYHLLVYFVKKVILWLLRNFDSPFQLFKFNKNSTIISAFYDNTDITTKLRILQYIYYRNDYIGLDLLKYVKPVDYEKMCSYHIKTKDFIISINKYDDIVYTSDHITFVINDSKRIELINFPEPKEPVGDLRTTEMLAELGDL